MHDKINVDEIAKLIDKIDIISNIRKEFYKKVIEGKYKEISTVAYKKLNKWVAQCDMNGKHKCIGYFDTEECAAKAYDRYVLSITKDTNYVYLNFPSE